MKLTPFDSWERVLSHVDAGGFLWYHAPLDTRPTAVHIIRRFKNGKLRLKGRDAYFTADPGHLDRMRRFGGP